MTCLCCGNLVPSVAYLSSSSVALNAEQYCCSIDHAAVSCHINLAYAWSMLVMNTTYDVMCIDTQSQSTGHVKGSVFSCINALAGSSRETGQRLATLSCELGHVWKSTSHEAPDVKCSRCMRCIAHKTLPHSTPWSLVPASMTSTS
jgi:hypothetical protein